MDPLGPNSYFKHPRSILEDSLPALKIAEPERAAKSNSLRDVYISDLGDWNTFEEDVGMFYKNECLQKTLDGFKSTITDANLSVIEKVSRYYAGLEHALIAEERDLHGRFLNNVIVPVYSAIATISETASEGSDKPSTVKHDMPLTMNMHFGSAKLVLPRFRDHKEPDIIFRIPREGVDAQAAILGELKFCGTCDLHVGWDNFESQTHHSLRHKLGQIARDMRACGVRFGFLFTYEWTMFLKIVEQVDETYALHRSKCYHFSDKAEYDPATGVLSKVNVRLGLAFLIHRVSHENRAGWSFPPSAIDPKEWTTEKTSENIGHEAWVYQSPYTPSTRPPDVFENDSISSRRSDDDADLETPIRAVQASMKDLDIEADMSNEPQLDTPRSMNNIRSLIPVPSPVNGAMQGRSRFMKSRRVNAGPEVAGQGASNATTSFLRPPAYTARPPGISNRQTPGGPKTRSKSRAAAEKGSD